MEDKNQTFMHRAVELARASLSAGGGPFGAVIVRDGRVVAEGANGVTLRCDPTAHAEITAIRAAAAALGTYDLSGCEIYTSCEPCPMCLGAIYWARLDGGWYAASRRDAASAGFDDSLIYDQIALPPAERTIPLHPLPAAAPEARAVFDAWVAKADKTRY